MKIFCVACDQEVEAVKVTGREIYPHRPDLADLIRWQCPTCKNHVGTHKNSKNHAPLGNIPTPELQKARQHLHALIDPLWKNGLIKRKDLDALITERVGWSYHTAKTRSVDEAREVYRVCLEIKKELEAIDD